MSKFLMSSQLRRRGQGFQARAWVFSGLEANPSSPMSSCSDGIDLCRDLDLNPHPGFKWLVALEVAISPRHWDDGGAASRSLHKTRRWKFVSELTIPLGETSGHPLTSLGLIFLTLKWRVWTKQFPNPSRYRSW